jgi:RNA recognition motif-containing protein
LAVRLFIGNLPYGASEADLRAHLATVAEPSQVVMPVDRETGRPRGFAFVEFPDRAIAEEIIRRFDAQPFQGRTLAVSEARAREDRPPGPRPSSRGPAAPRPAGGAGRTAAPAGPPPPVVRDRSANFGPPAPPRRLRGKKQSHYEHRPRGPIKERTGGRIYDVDDLDDDQTIDIDDFATRADREADLDDADRDEKDQE